MRNKVKKFDAGYSPWNYVGNMGSMAATGMSVAGVPGAIVGAGVGLFQSLEQEQAAKEAAAREKMIASMTTNRNLTNSMRANYDLNNKTNTGIPGFKDGLAGAHTPMKAKVSKGEVLRDPLTGDLTSVPGDYNSAYPDTVNTVIPKGASVYSANNEQAMPFGKSTPASIAKKMEKSQNVKYSKGRISETTKALNEKNIEAQAKLLDMYTAMNGGAVGGNSFDKGKVGTNNYKVPVDMYGNPLPVKAMVSQVALPGEFVVTASAKKTQPAATKPTSTKTAATKKVTAPVISTAPSIAPRDTREAWDQDVETSYLSQDRLRLSKANPISIPLGSPSNPLASIAPSMIQTGTPFKANTDELVGAISRDARGQRRAKFNEFVDKYKGPASDMLMDLGALAPSLSNLAETPDKISPIYSQFVNPLQTYDMSQEMSNIKDQTRIARYNQKNMGGSSMPYGAAVAAGAVSGMSDLYGKANQFNATQKGEYANRANQQGAMDANEARRVQDVNMRSEAASNNINKEGLSQISEFLQTKKLSKNMKARDKQQLLSYMLTEGVNFGEYDLKKLSEIFGIDLNELINKK